MSFDCSWQCADLCDQEIQLCRTREQSPSQGFQWQVSHIVAETVSVVVSQLTLFLSVFYVVAESVSVVVSQCF